MSTLTANQGLVIPATTDPDNVPSAFAALAATLEPRLVMKFDSVADRTNRYPVPTEGDVSYRRDARVYEQYRSGAWRSMFPSLSRYRAVSNALLGLTAAAQDVPNCTTSFSVVGTNAFAFVHGVFDLSKTAAVGQGLGVCTIDGVDQAENAVFSDNGNAVSDRQTVAQIWTPSLAVGPHTIKLRAAKAGAATVNCNPTHTTIDVLLVDIP